MPPSAGLPDFLIQIPEPASRVRARDIPAGAFFFGFADNLPFTDCFQAADWNEQQAVTLGLERWITGLLTRAIIDPILTPELIQRLGPSRDVIAKTYLETVGWLPRNPDSIPATIAPLSRKRRPPFDLICLTAPPGRNLHGILKQMTTRTRTLPTTLWALPISQWIFTLRVLADPETPMRPDEGFLRALGVDL